MNKVALITGGVRRLGRQISLYLASKGYDLAIIYNSSSAAEIKRTSALLNAFGIKYKLYKCDLKNTKLLRNTINTIGKDFKKIDVLVNNSGVIKKIDLFDITEKMFDDTIAVNLKAPLFVSQFAVKYLNRSKAPVIINIASLGGMQNWSGFIPYSLSKTGAVKLTYLLARRLAPKIRVNAIAPGTIIILGQEHGTPKKIDIAKIPLKKYGTSADIINAVEFIIECSYLTGHVIPVDGGRLLNN
ncbi:MAG: SDR family oxidoreductase [Ignavibacteria bacterium]|nr:SDR family oxidoreductase [Ignavibacteria bacterium]